MLAVLATILGGYGASQLSIDTDISNLVPEDYESVQALDTLQRTVGGERDMAVAISSPSFEANKAFAEDFIPRALSLRREADTSATYLTRVEYKREVEFLKDNALYFASDQELRQVEDFLDDQIAEAKRARQDANPFYFELEEEEGGTADTAETTEESGEALEGVYGAPVPAARGGGDHLERRDRLVRGGRGDRTARGHFVLPVQGLPGAVGARL